MPLYSGALAPAVKRYEDGQPMPAIEDNSGGTASGDFELVAVTDTTSDVSALINANFATLAAYIDRLIDHLNNGRTS